MKRCNLRSEEAIEPTIDHVAVMHLHYLGAEFSLSALVVLHFSSSSLSPQAVLSSGLPGMGGSATEA